MALIIEPSAPGTDLWAVFTPGFYFDCAVQSARPFKIHPGEWLPFCGTISNWSTSHSGPIVQATPSGFGTGSLVVAECSQPNCPTRHPPPGVKLPPHSIAIPLAAGTVAVFAQGPPLAPTSDQAVGDIAPKPKRSVSDAKAIVSARLAEVEAQLDHDYPRPEVGRMRDSAEAMRTVIGWNTVWDQRVKVGAKSFVFLVTPYIFSLQVHCIYLHLVQMMIPC